MVSVIINLLATGIVRYTPLSLGENLDWATQSESWRVLTMSVCATE